MSDEKKMLVGLGSPLVSGSPPTIMLGMTPAAFDEMTDGRTHTFDMTKVGIPVQIVIYRGDTHAELAETLKQAAEIGGSRWEDRRGRGPLPNLGIDEPSKH